MRSYRRGFSLIELLIGCTVTVMVVGAAPIPLIVAGNGNGTVEGDTISSVPAANAFVYTLNEQNIRNTSVYKGAAVAKTCWLITGAEC